MSEGESNMVNKSESSSFEDLASAAIAEEIELAMLAEKEKSKDDDEPKPYVWQDLLGSGALMKKILKPGDEESGLRAQRGDVAEISYQLKVRDTGDVIVNQENIKIYLGDNEELQGIDLALTLMYKGESCMLELAPRFAYGETGLKPGERLGLVSDPAKLYSGPIIGPETWIAVNLELHNWCEEPEHGSLSVEQRMDLGKRRRVRGNWWYKRGELPLAVQLYRRALDILDEAEGGITDPTPSGDVDLGDSALYVLFQERLMVYNNMAAVQLKAGAYDAALQAVSRVLSCTPNDAKALFRKCKILSAMGKNSEALEAIRAAAIYAPEDFGVMRALQRCEQIALKELSAERKLAKRMLGANERPAKVIPVPDKKPSRAKIFVWGTLIFSILVGVASVLVYRYKIQQ